jgi:thiazole tautomerase (transcriptional regulator TenI)
MAKRWLVLISDGKTDLPTARQVFHEVAPYCDRMILREKQRTAKEIDAWIDTLSLGEKLIVNDRLDAALANRTGGVHLAWHSLPIEKARRIVPKSMLLGVSVHSAAEAVVAAKSGADYVLFGHIYESGSKPGQPGRGLAALREVVAAVSIPVIALGGITVERVDEVLSTGCAGVAVMSAILSAPDPKTTAQRFRAAIDRFQTYAKGSWST